MSGRVVCVAVAGSRELLGAVGRLLRDASEELWA